MVVVLHALGLSGVLLGSAAMAPVLPAKPRLLVTVRHEGPAPLDRQATDQMLAEARDIWRPYVEVTFAHEGESSRPIAVDEIELVITSRPPSGDGAGLGWIEFENGTPSHTITVSTTAVERFMEASAWGGRPLTTLPYAAKARFVIRALARGVAHEIGHYLLRSTEHARKGLMRPMLTGDDLMLSRRHDTLEAADRARLDRRLWEYAQAATPSRPPA